MSNNEKKPPTGFTLVDILLALAVMGMIVLGATAIFYFSTQARVKAQTIFDVESEAAALLVLSRTAALATSITTPTTGTSGAILTLKSGSISTTIDVAGNALRMRIGPLPAVALTSSRVEVTDFTVRNLTRTDGIPIARVQITLRHTNPNNQSAYTYEQNYAATFRVGK